ASRFVRANRQRNEQKAKSMRTTLLVMILLLITPGRVQLNSTGGQESDRIKELANAMELNAQVVKLYSEQQYKEALPLARQVVDIRQRWLLPNDTLLGSAFSNLAELYLALKKNTDAEKIFQEALAVYESHPDQQF